MGVESLLASKDTLLAWRARFELSGEDDPVGRKAAYADPRIRALVDGLREWPGEPLSSHKSPRQCFQRLAFLADMGIRSDAPGMREVLKAVKAGRGADGMPRLPMTIGEAHGGTGEETLAWALCDAPVTLRSLALVDGADAKTGKAVKSLAALSREGGWPCAVSPELGSWRGPGKKSDPCPFATLAMTRLLLEFGDEYRKEIELGAKALLRLWEMSRTEHPYIFYMGTDFRKPKFPFVWYDILPVADTLSRVPSVAKDPRFVDMMDTLRANLGDYVPGSVYQYWKDWDFGQKKRPSEWIELAALRIERRLLQAGAGSAKRIPGSR